VIPTALAERLGLPPGIIERLRLGEARRKAHRVNRAAAKQREAARVAAVYASMPKLRPDAPRPSPRVAGAPCPSSVNSDAPRFPPRKRRGPVPLQVGTALTPVGSSPPSPVGAPCPSPRDMASLQPTFAVPLSPERSGTPHPLGKASPSRRKEAAPLPKAKSTRAKQPLALRDHTAGGTQIVRTDFAILFTNPRHVRADLRDLRAAVRARRVTPENTPFLVEALERALPMIFTTAPSMAALQRRLRGVVLLLIQMNNAGDGDAASAS